jgi:hypothetical protein
MRGAAARRLAMEERKHPPSGDPRDRPLSEIVPERAVLTELARGFLLVHEADPERARRFAQTFLREHEAAPESRAPVPQSRLAMVRHGVHSAIRDGLF